MLMQQSNEFVKQSVLALTGPKQLISTTGEVTDEGWDAINSRWNTLRTTKPTTAQLQQSSRVNQWTSS